MMVIELREYAELRNKTYQEALEEAKEGQALCYEGKRILINVEKITKYLEGESIDGLINIKSLEV